MFGPVGAGKSTQANLLVERFGYEWVSTGNLFRETTDPEMIAYLQTGKLVSDEQTEKLVEAALNGRDLSKVILDGFPRNLNQAEWLLAKDYGIDLGIVIELDSDEAVSRMRLRGRDDDTEDAIRERLAIYHQQVDPCIEYLVAQGVKIVKVSGLGTVEEIHDSVVAVLTEHSQV